MMDSVHAQWMPLYISGRDLVIAQGGAGTATLILALCSAAVLFLLYLRTTHSSNNFPLLGKWDVDDLRQVIGNEASRAIKQDQPRVYALRMPIRDILVVPHSLLKDYGWAPEHHVSSSIDLHERALGRYTLLSSTTPEAPGDRMGLAVSYAKGPITRQQAPLLRQVYEEIEFALSQDLPSCNDWTSLRAHDFSVKLNLRIYERLYVGLDLSRNQEWVNACTTYSGAIAAAAAALAQYPEWQRPVASYFVPEMSQLRRELQNLVRLLKPHHQDRLKKLASDSNQSDKPNDFIEHYILNSIESNQGNTKDLAVSLAGINFAGIQSTGGVLVQALYDLAARPEYIQPLRDELESTIDGDQSNLQSIAVLSKLTKLDSFIKESQKFTHNNLLSVYRKIRKPLALSNGSHLPANSYVAVAGSAYARINEHGDEAEFDGFRWAKLREQPENKGKFLAATAAEDAVEFGYGSHACPGRFLASNVVKLSLAALLLRFDIKAGKGFDGDVGGCKRPAPSYNAMLVLKPNPDAEIILKRRGDGDE